MLFSDLTWVVSCFSCSSLYKLDFGFSVSS